MTKLGRHLIIGFQGTKPSEELIDFIRAEEIGGVILFKRNWRSLKQFKDLIDTLKEAAGGKLLISIDHEGGRVNRLPKPFTRFPSMRQAAAQGEAAIYKIGAAMAQELSAIGINVNFAPVLDVATNAFNTVIGDRAFATDPEEVSNLAILMIQGFLDGRVMPCGKHFPGHGDTDDDSHLTLPVLPHTRRRLELCEFVPFRKAIAAGVPAIMTAHILLPNIDPVWPASLSRRITTEILRNELKFDGVIITDDLLMQAITSRLSPEEAAVRALVCGADMVLVCNDLALQKRVLSALKKAADRGELAKNNKSLRRIRRIVDQFCDPSIEHPPMSVIGCKDHRQLLGME